MTSSRNRLGTAAAFIVVGVFSMTFDSTNAEAQPDSRSGSAPVTIVNPLPLPVTGSFTVKDNSSSNPLFVRDVDAEQRVPVQLRGVLTPFEGGYGATILAVVPAGKLLVIEHVSISINARNAASVIECGLGTATPTAFDYMLCQPMGSDALNNFYAANSQTKFYVQPGNTLVATVATLSGGGSIGAFASGYYVPIP